MFKKGTVLLFVLFALCCLSANAQQLNYQAIARNANGVALTFRDVGIRLSIRDGSPTGSIVYSETRNIRTNQFGLFTVVIGSPGASSVLGSMASINWISGNKYLQVEIDPEGGTTYFQAGTSQLQAVPYALFANAAYPVGPAGGDLVGSTYPNPIIAPLAVTTGKIANQAVTTAKIADLNVTTAKLEDQAVTNPKIQDNTIANIKLVNPRVTLNGLILNLGDAQNFAIGSTGLDVNIVSAGNTHTFNFPDASIANRGLITPNAQTIGGNKTFNNNITAASIIRAGGLASQFLKADGSVDNNIYLTENQPIIVTATGDATGVSTSSRTAPVLPLTLATVNSTVGTYGTNIVIPSITVNNKGLVTNVIANPIPTATSITSGLLTVGDWNIFNNKQNAIPLGSAAQYFRGDLSLSNFQTDVRNQLSAGTNITYVNGNIGLTNNSVTLNSLPLTLGGAQTFATGTAGVDFNINSAGSVHTFNIPTASVFARGVLSSTDYTNFNTAYANRITSLTTTGTSGAATLSGNVLNIPNYTIAGLGGEASITPGTTLQYWRGDKTWQTLNSSVVPEGSNLYYTDTRSRNALSITTTGNNGTASYNNATGIMNIPAYTINGLGGVPTSRLINGLDLSADRNLTTTEIAEGTRLYFTNARSRTAIGITTTGSNGVSTYDNTTGILNIPNYTYTLPAATTTTLGGVITGANITNTSGTISITGNNVIDALGSQTANRILVAPNGVNGSPSFRAMVTEDMPDNIVTNAKLANSSINLGTTNIPLGTTANTLLGLTSITSGAFVGPLIGNANTASTWANQRTLSTTGDVLYTSNPFDGSANTTGVATLANSGVTAGIYGSANEIPRITVDAKGRLTSVSTNLISGVSPLGSSLNAGNIIVGSAANIAAQVPMSGDVTITPTGVTAIGALRVTDAMLAPGITDGKLATISTLGKVANSATTATNLNNINTIVLRDAAGDFSAGNITANLIGNVTGNVSGSAGSVINNISFNNGGIGDASGTSFNGSAARIISYNSIGASPLAGSTSLTTLGTITTGTWNGNVIGNTFGGAGTSNGLLKANGAGLVSAATVGTDYLAPFASQTQNFVFAAPSGANGTPSFRAITATDIPTLNQNTTGSAGSVLNNFTFNNSGTGDASGTSFNGAIARTLSYNSIGASPLAGSTSLTTLGTITTGTWNGNVIGNAFGGAGTSNGLLKANGAGLVSAATVGTDYLAPFASQTQNFVFAAPSGANGTPSFRAITATDIPTLNQNTTGTAGSVLNNFTFNNSGAGDASGTSFNGAIARTLSYNSIGASPLAGSTSLTTLGTITTGTWNGNVIGNAFGGAGTANGILKADGAGLVSAATVGTDYLAPFASQTQNFVFAAPSGANGTPNFRAITATDIPTLNQNTTGTAGSVSNTITFNNGGAGDASGTTFNGGAARTISYNSIGASPLAGSTSLTTTGTITTGTWNANLIPGEFGGTGVNNTGRTITLGGNVVTAGNLTTVGAFATTLTSTGATNVTLPITGTLATLAETETFTNKTLTSPIINTPAINYTNATGITAGANTQGTTPLTNDLNIITTSSAPSAVTLPTAIAGRRITIVNRGVNPINIFPATGAQIDGLVANAAYSSIPPSGYLEFYAASPTQWYSSSNATSATQWNITGNSGLTAGTHFLGTTDNIPLRFRVNNTWAGEVNPASINTSFGLGAGQAITAALAGNTAFGAAALLSNTTSVDHTAVGQNALQNTNGGSNNTAVGKNALQNNVSGFSNTAVGHAALLSSLNNNNSALGKSALTANTDGTNNTGVGHFALVANTTGNANTAVGQNSLSANTTTHNNTAVGFEALRDVTSDGNVGVGYQANVSAGVSSAVTIGIGSSVTANNAIAIGSSASATAANAVAIGNGATNAVTNTIRLGGAANLAVVTSGSMNAGKFVGNNSGTSLTHVSGIIDNVIAPTLSGNDVAGFITFTTGGVPAGTGNFITVNFGSAYAGGNPVVIIQPVSNTAPRGLATSIYCLPSTTTTGSFIISTGAALLASTEYQIAYHVIGRQ